MPAEALRLFVFARHAEAAANAAGVLNTNPSKPVALTARGRRQARALGAQLAGLREEHAGHAYAPTGPQASPWPKRPR